MIGRNDSQFRVGLDLISDMSPNHFWLPLSLSILSFVCKLFVTHNDFCVNFCGVGIKLSRAEMKCVLRHSTPREKHGNVHKCK